MEPIFPVFETVLDAICSENKNLEAKFFAKIKNGMAKESAGKACQIVPRLS